MLQFFHFIYIIIIESLIQQIYIPIMAHTPKQQPYQIYLNQALQIGKQIVQYELFEELVIILTVCLFFFIGRLSYEKKLTHLLEMVNDAETTRKKLTSKLQNEGKMLTTVSTKKFIVWIISAVLVLANAAYYYFTRKINIYFIIYTIAPLVLIWVGFILSIKYLQWNKVSTQKRLKNTSITAQAQIKQILKIFGQGLKGKLRSLYENDLEMQWTKQSKQQCKLYKCYNEKKSYQDLFKLYQQIINQIKKFNMCDVCLNEDNISVQKLGLNEMENIIKNFKRARAGKLTMAQKKEMVNKLLAQYQKMNEKLPFICKKGCCIKQRVLIENAKAKYHDRLKRLHNQLATSIQK